MKWHGGPKAPPLHFDLYVYFGVSGLIIYLMAFVRLNIIRHRDVQILPISLFGRII